MRWFVLAVLLSGCGVSLSKPDWRAEAGANCDRDTYECELDAHSVASTGGRETFGEAQNLAEKAWAADLGMLLGGADAAYDISARGWLEAPDSLRVWYLRGFYVSQLSLDDGLKCPEQLSLGALLAQVNASVAQVLPDRKNKVPVAFHVMSAMFDLGCRNVNR